MNVFFSPLYFLCRAVKLRGEGVGGWGAFAWQQIFSRPQAGGECGGKAPHTPQKKETRSEIQKLRNLEH